MPDAEAHLAPEGREPARSHEELLVAGIDLADWEQKLGGHKSFYVRGATWFTANVIENLKDLAGYSLDRREVIIDRLPGFATAPIKWGEKFSHRQAAAALTINRKPLKLQKATQTILLCDQIVRIRVAEGRLEMSPDEALRRMRIEPAVFYVQDFDREQFDDLTTLQPQLDERLRTLTGQRTRSVFKEMIIGHTVTKRLADATKAALGQLFEGREVGAVDCGLRPVNATTKGPTIAAAPSEALSDE
jgi:hypothetical protein